MEVCFKNVLLKHIKSTVLLGLFMLPVFGVSQGIAQQSDLPIFVPIGEIQRTVINEVIPSSDGAFANAVSVSGNRLAVAAPNRSLLGPDAATRFSLSRGTVFIFERNANGEWVETAEINRDEFGATDSVSGFGHTLILEGDRLLIGTDDNGSSSEPVAFVYEYTQQEGWVLDARSVSYTHLTLPTKA